MHLIDSATAALSVEKVRECIRKCRRRSRLQEKWICCWFFSVLMLVAVAVNVKDFTESCKCNIYKSIYKMKPIGMHLDAFLIASTVFTSSGLSNIIVCKVHLKYIAESWCRSKSS